MRSRLGVLAGSWVVVAGFGACASDPPPRGAPRAHRGPVTPTVEIANDCADAVPVFFGETPNGESARHFVLRGGSTSHVQRDPSGELVVWITDDEGFGVVHVRASPRIRRVQIGTSCKSLHAE